ncbi:metallophosphoesterase family protein [Leifsonia poae]|uniref:metallophosphoesterase family protein n=1 Tax=Leifsonia poae TaxID=110933 RepID=UPI001CBEC233|nr:metallophosphoesterase [Leifsonia poae]
MTFLTAPAERGLRILHLSDTHLFGDGSLHYGIVDTLAALDRVLDRAGELAAVDVVVVSGDLSDDGSEESYRLLARRIVSWANARGAAVVYAMGNHDLRAGFETVLGARESAVEVAGFRIVTVDSSVPGAGYGAVDAAQLQILSGILREPAPHGTVVVLHHPPVPAASALLAALELQNPAELLAACSAGDVRLVLAGHYHHALATVADGIPVVVAPGVANTADAIAPAGTERATVGSGFAVIDLPLSGEPRALFIPAPSVDDGTEIFDLSAAEVERIAAAAGPAA